MAISHIVLMQMDEANSARVSLSNGGASVVINSETEGVILKIKDLISSINLLQAAYFDEQENHGPAGNEQEALSGTGEPSRQYVPGAPISVERGSSD